MRSNQNPFHSKVLEKWLESFFLDPTTITEDQTQFQIDLFDSDTELMIEAMLPNYSHSEVSVYLDKTNIIITAFQTPQHKKERSVNFPFPITAQKVDASFFNGKLEINISKIQNVKSQNRNVPLTN